jgi:competence protein ComEC
MNIQKQIIAFCNVHPLLVPSLLFLEGVALALSPSFYLLIPLLPIVYLNLRKPLQIFFLIFAFLYGKWNAPLFPSDLSSLQTTATLHVLDIQQKKSHKHKDLQAKVLIHSSKTVKNLPCFMKITSLSMIENSCYEVEGTIYKKDGFFTFVPSGSWKAKGAPWSLPKMRFICKRFFAKHIEKLYPSPYVHKLLTALTLGSLEDPLLRFSFGKLGLQHILAISGFHFAILSLCFGIALRIFLPRRTTFYALLFLLTLYLLLIGAAPSILRAYLAAILYLISNLIGIRSRAINLLSATLLFELILTPTSILSLGFQLSFLATAAILFVCPVATTWIEWLLPKRTLSEALSLHTLEKAIYLLCSILRPLFALNLSIILILVPTTLWCFSSFPLISLIYNLFIPWCITLSIFLFLLGLSFFYFPPVSDAIHSINNFFTEKTVNLLTQSPNCLDYTLSSPKFPLPILYLYLLLAFGFCIAKHQKHNSIYLH